MKEKDCYGCKKLLPISRFRKSLLTKNRLDTYCKACRSTVHAESRKKNIHRNRLYILSYLDSHPCIDCGEDDVVVLTFDHLKSKSYALSRLVSTGANLQKLIKEIEKCVVRCSNCHMRKTAKQFNHYKTQKKYTRLKTSKK